MPAEAEVPELTRFVRGQYDARHDACRRHSTPLTRPLMAATSGRVTADSLEDDWNDLVHRSHGGHCSNVGCR